MSTDAINRTSPAASYLAEAEAGLDADPATQMASMMLVQAKESRQAGKSQRSLEEKHLRGMERTEIQKMRSEAKQILKAAKTEAFGKMASGGLQALGGGVQMYGSGSVGDAAALRNFDGAVGAMKGGAAGAEGGTKWVAADHTKKAANRGTEAKQAQHAQRASKARLDSIDDQVGQAAKLSDTALEAMKQSAQTRTATDQAAIFLRG